MLKIVDQFEFYSCVSRKTDALFLNFSIVLPECTINIQFLEETKQASVSMIYQESKTNINLKK